jgi:hypothetical protein
MKFCVHEMQNFRKRVSSWRGNGSKKRPPVSEMRYTLLSMCVLVECFKKSNTDCCHGNVTLQEINRRVREERENHERKTATLNKELDSVRAQLAESERCRQLLLDFPDITQTSLPPQRGASHAPSGEHLLDYST